VKTELVCVESEHSAMSACVGSAAAGARTFTATSSQGLALMFEIVYIAASYRLPIVMPVVNRALSGPINIHCDHSDAMACRDTGWIQLFSENAQEVYDNVIQAFRIAEHHDVLLPVTVNLDGFILSHTMETLDLLDDEAVQTFVGEYEPATNLLDLQHPVTMGPLHLQDNYFEVKRGQQEAMWRALPVIEKVGAAFAEISGRHYGWLEPYRLDDAEFALVALGSTAGTAKDAVDELRDQGVSAGLLKIRCYRPFPGPQIAQALSHCKIVGVLDRSISFGLAGGPLFNEIRSFMYGQTVPLASYIYGLGGRDITVTELVALGNELKDLSPKAELSPPVRFIGVRE
jgi:pyruvate ferredoxin oxidoreductase alpha subunit